MFRNIRSWQIFLAVAFICAAAFGGVYWWNAQRSANVAELFRRLPSERALVLGVNVRALRDAGILETLAGSREVEELDYREFVEQTGFDYREDLDYIAAALDADHKYFLLRGRFDWALMKRFSAAKGAQCVNLFCSVRSSEAGKNVSYFPLSQNVLALAQGFAPRAAYTLMTDRELESDLVIPDYAIWGSLPGPLLTANQKLPDGVNAFASTLATADRLTLGMTATVSGLEVHLDAVCPNKGAADEMAAKLRTLTELLQKMIARGGAQPNPANLGAVLSSGQFESSGTRVTGKWPVPRTFLENLAAGTL